MTDPVDLRVTGARVVTPGGTIEGGIAAQDGRIVAVGGDRRLPPAETEVDADGNYLLPGVIDPHVHLGRRGEHGYREQLRRDFETETRGALHGGVTSLINFVEQGDRYLPDLEGFVSAGEERSYVDFTHHFVLSHDHHLEELSGLADAGLRSLKMFFNMYKYTDIDIEPVEAHQVYEVLGHVAETPNAIGLFHAENAELALAKGREVRASGRHDLEAWSDASPGMGEAMQIEHVGMLAGETGARAYVVHVTSEPAVEALERHQRRGVQVYGEALVSHLACTYRDDLGVWGKISPPLRSPRDRERLWAALRTGTIDHVGTDHLADDLEHKEMGEGRRGEHLWEAPPGAQPGMEYLLPVMLSEGVNGNRISIERLVEVTSTNTAKRFGLYPRKGALVEGADADAVIVDLERSATIDESFYHTREPRWSPVHGMEVRGLPTHTIAGGELAVAEGDLLVDPGRGEHLPVYDGGVERRG